MATTTPPPVTPTPPPVTANPESRLDRMARDLSRTLLHGSRSQDTSGNIGPATIATGQQVRVDLPAAGPMNFNFTAGASASPVSIAYNDAAGTETFMSAALGADAANYLTLSADPDIPTWVFQQRQFTIKNPPADEDVVAVTLPDNSTSPPGTIQLAALNLPTSALEEVDDGDCYVSLYSYDAVDKVLAIIAAANWQPAVVVRFPLTNCTPAAPQTFPPGMQVFGIAGTPEGDRWFLDQLGLLSNIIPGPVIPNPPAIAGISLSLETVDSSGKPTRSLPSDWTIARTNLTREARFGQASDEAVNDAPAAAPLPPVTLPYVAVSGVGPAQDQDAIRLLEMTSITNSGGYYLRATTGQTDAQSLVLTVILQPQPDPDTSNAQSTWLPSAANAVALTTGTSPVAIRFNGLQHIDIAPFTPPGTVCFGWTRTEPQDKTTDEDQFGFGTISMVDYSAQDGTGQFLCHADSVIAISPLQGLNGDHYQRLLPSGTTGAGSPTPSPTAKSAAMRPLARRRSVAAPADVVPNDAPATMVSYYRSTLACFGTGQSPWVRLANPSQSQITFTPSFRDVFGNRFPASTGPTFVRRLFYTDPLINPAEWPGIRFSVYPTTQAEEPALAVEMSYRRLPPLNSSNLPTDKSGRLQRLVDICTQLNGVNGDVTVTFSVPSLITTQPSLNCAAIAQQVQSWHDMENLGQIATDGPLVMSLGSFTCDGQITNLIPFQPTVTVARTNPAYCPQPTDLPQDPNLSALISKQVTAAAAAVILQATATPAGSLDQTQEEFLQIAQNFQLSIAGPMNLQAGFLRDQNNQHQLWIIPNSFFPVPDPSPTAVWTFATPRPLSNTLGTESFQAPNFTLACPPPPASANCWGNYQLVSQTLVDQDYDQLGRTVLSLLETETSDLSILTLSANADLMRSILATREQIANALAAFSGPGTPWLVPLFATPGDLDGAAITRIATDAFLTDLTSFYRVSTIIQLPLNPVGNTGILTFEGTVTTTPTITATFSDVLVSGGDRKITLLYDLPADPTEASQVPAITSLQIAISHVQLPVAGSAPVQNPFSQGQWLELAQPYSLTWKGYPDIIPVAERTFPAKPVIQSTESLMAWENLTTGAVTLPGSINATTAALLAQWGWTFTFGLMGATPDDTVHIAVNYNGATGPAPAAAPLAVPAAWQPGSLLQSLFVLKLLQDNWAAMAADVRLTVLSQLAPFLAGFLSAAPAPAAASALATNTLVTDAFTLQYNQTTVGGNPRPVMAGAITVTPWAPLNGLAVTTLTAPAEAAGNAAFLTGTAPVRNFKVQLQLYRNETFGKVLEGPADKRLIYQCAPVESPLDCWPQNLWAPPVPPLIFDMTAPGQTLLAALTAFFTGIFNGADLTTMSLDVGISLAWSKGKLSAVTPFSILPTDLPPAPGTAQGVAAFVFAKCQALLTATTPAPPETDYAAIRLHVKITEFQAPGQVTPSHTLLEIDSIDFQLT